MLHRGRICESHAKAVVIGLTAPEVGDRIVEKVDIARECRVPGCKHAVSGPAVETANAATCCHESIAVDRPRSVIAVSVVVVCARRRAYISGAKHVYDIVITDSEVCKTFGAGTAFAMIGGGIVVVRPIAILYRNIVT